MTDFDRRIAALSAEKRALFERLRGGLTTAPFSLVCLADRPLLPAGLEDAYPLSSVQLGMLVHMQPRQDMPSPPAYHNVNTFHLRFPFHFDCFQKAVNRVVARHPTLRTSFDLLKYSEPLQLVHQTATLPVTLVDLRGLSEGEQSAECEAFIAAENFRLLDLSHPPLMRLCIHRLADDRVKLSLTEPHSISDGWSTHLTLLEIFESHLALVNNSRWPDKQALTVTYRDFIHLEREAIRSEECRQFWSYKSDKFAMTPLPRLTSTSSSPVGLDDHKLYTPIEPEIVAALQRLAAGIRVPFKSVLLAAHLKFISLMTGEPDISTGLVVNGRPEVRDGDQVRGLFLNTVPLRVRLAAGTWIDLCRQAYEAETEVLPFRRFPLGNIQELSGHVHLFDAVFSYHHFHSITHALQAGWVEVLDGGSDLSRTNFPLGVVFAQDPMASSNLVLVMEYDVTEFRKPQIESMRDRLIKVLGTLSRSPTESHVRRCLLTEEESRRVLGDWSGTEESVAERCGHELFEKQAALRPEAIALEVLGESLMSYGELNRRADRLAYRLEALGVGPEELVGVYLERSLESVVALLGILKAGGAYLPLDPRYPANRLGFILANARPRVVLTQVGLARSLPPGAVRTLCLDESVYVGEQPDGRLQGARPENLAYVIYTSGSTGVPKGVLVSHRGLANLVTAQVREFGVGPGERILQFSSPSFDASVAEVLMALGTGATLCLAVNRSQLSGVGLEDVLERGGITNVTLPPSSLAAVGKRPLPELRTLIVAGEVCPADLAARWAAGRRLFNAYGPTESTIWATVAKYAGESGRIPIGRPISNIRVYVLDRDGEPVPVGVTGELYIGGVGVARGYLGRPDLTAEKFVPDPFSGERGWRLYRTGDRVRFRSDGVLEFLGRRDGQVKLRGHRIELEEVEAVLGQYPGVEAAVVTVRGDVLVAYVVAPPPGPTAAELRRHLRGHLPEYMLPGSYVRLERLPVTPNGKLDRHALPSQESARLELGTPSSPPADEIERAVAELWKELLGAENVGIHDNFFDLGGHSLLLARAHGRLLRMFQTNLSMVQMFEYPTVAALARYLREGGAHPETALSADGTTERMREGKLRMRQRLEKRKAEPGTGGGA